MLSRKTLIRLAVFPTVAAVALTGAIAFGTAKPPPRMISIDANAAEAEHREPAPDLQRFKARDGTALAYRAYRPANLAPGAPVAILIHGSGGESANMNIMARALMAQGIPAYAPDIRGHGQSGRRGDIDHIGQLEDDLSDLVAVVRKDYPAAPLVLAGHSSGGGFVLRIASEPEGRQFKRFVLLAPFLGAGRPTTRPASGGWVSAYVPRIIGLTIINRFGVTAFNGLPTLAFAASPRTPLRTWSYRLMQNFAAPGLTQLGGDPVIEAADKTPGPISVIVGDHDESMVPTAYAPAFAKAKPAVSVRIIPGVGHMQLISEPPAIEAAVQAIRG